MTNMNDIINNTPEGKKAVEKAVRQSIADQEAMTNTDKNETPKNVHIGGADVNDGVMSNTTELYSHFRGVTMEQVIKISVNEGEGVTGDPTRRVTYWYTQDGELIGHNDPAERQFVPKHKEEHHE